MVTEKNQKSKPKRYIEFFGIRKAGKSAIRKALQETLASEGVNTYYRKKFESYGVFKALIYPAITNPERVLQAFLSSVKSRNVLTEAGISFKQFMKNQLVNNFLFFEKDVNYFLDESFLHMALRASSFYLDRDKILKVLDFYPTNEIFLVFVDTSPETAFSREIRAKNLTNLEIQKGIKAEKYNAEKFRKAFSILQKISEGGRLKRVMKVNGERSIIKNVEVIKNKISKSI